MSKARILLTGTPGNVGTPLVDELKAMGVPFRVGARRPENAAQVLGDDVEIVPFDFKAPETFKDAFDGIERVFLVRPPALANVSRDIAPAVWAGIGAGVQHVVFLSVQGVEKNPVIPHRRIEALLKETGVGYTSLRAGFFMQNLTTVHADEIRQGVIDVPVGKTSTAYIDVRDIAAVAARALTENGHDGKAYTLTGGESLDYHQVAAILSQELGYTVRYAEPSLLTFIRNSLRRGRGWTFSLMMSVLYTLTRFGMAKTVSPDVRDVLGREPITLAQFAADHRHVWLPETESAPLDVAAQRV